MRIAIFMAQTDTSDFAKAHPDDGQKFAAMLRAVRPDWTFDVHRVAFGDLPARIEADAGLITGSIASANDPADWIAWLEDRVRAFDAARRPLFGACFGHQIIARALGGTVGANPGGWRFSLAPTTHDTPLPWLEAPGRPTLLHAAHSEQVVRLPDGVRTTGSSPGCAIAAMAKGRHIATTQYHPEMDRAFFRGLVPLLRGTVPEPQLEAALAEGRPADNALYAHGIATFFEMAHQ